MMGAYEKTRNEVEKYGTDWRTAAYVAALTRLEVVFRDRGIFP
jgi:glutamate dehydrogenase (NAD(P)+)